jgi:FkbM family methyltransferase
MPPPSQSQFNLLKSERLFSALTELGKDHLVRRDIIRRLRELELALPKSGVDVRESITGPLVDALFTPGEIQSKQLSNGLNLTFKYSSKIAREFVMAGDRPEVVWEPQTTKLLLSLAPYVDTAVIAGAYFGDQALLLAKSLKERDGRCLCFEVDTRQLELLELNARANRLDNLIPVGKGVWSQSAVQLELTGEDAYGSPHVAIDGAAGIEAVTIDEYAKRLGIQHIELITLDIEGAEFEALKGSQSFLSQEPARAPHIIFEVHRNYVDWSSGLKETDIARFLISFGYSIYAIRDYQANVDMLGRHVELIPIESVYLEGPPHGFNMFATKQPSLLASLGVHIVRDVSPKLLFHRDARLHTPGA